MNDYRYQLDPRRPHIKYRCPSCGYKSLTLYVDTEEGTLLGEEVGRCDHEVTCGYHKSPKEYFDECKKLQPDWLYQPKKNTGWTLQIRPRESTPSFIAHDIMERSFGHYDINPLYKWFSGIVGSDKAEKMFRLYNVGTSRKWGGATVYWQVDTCGNVRTGKVMGYDERTGKRIKEPTNQVSWAHTELGLTGYNLQQCMFGEHLLTSYPSHKVAIVESEKTAIIAKSFIPEFVWLATGGKNGCFNRQAMETLRNRDVLLVPDLKCEEDWRQRADRVLNGITRSYSVSDVIAKQATAEQFSMGLDIADFLLMEPTPQMVLQSMIDKNPYIKEFIEQFQCTLVEDV